MYLIQHNPVQKDIYHSLLLTLTPTVQSLSLRLTWLSKFYTTRRKVYSRIITQTIIMVLVLIKSDFISN